MSSANIPRYGIGGGADINFELDLSSIWPNPIGIGYTVGLVETSGRNEHKSDRGFA